MKMYFMVFASGKTDTLKLFESEVDEMAKTLLTINNEKFVKVKCKGEIYKTFYK